MDEFEKYQHEHLLDHYKSMNKTISRKITWQKWYIGLCVFNAITFTFNAIKYFNNKSFIFLIYGILIFAWIGLSYWTNKTIKKDKISLKNYQNLEIEELKILDYPKYLKTERTKKLKKLKASGN